MQKRNRIPGKDWIGSDEAIRIGIALTRARDRKGWTQTVLGEKLSMGWNSIGDIERGQAGTTLSRLLSLCEVLDLEIKLVPKEKE